MTILEFATSVKVGAAMVNWFRSLFHKPALESFDSAPTRERLIQSGRVVIIDDEVPLLIEEMRKKGFAVDHDKTGDDLHNVDNQIYDVAIVDYHGVGHRLGAAQGLDLLKYIKRVSPRTRLIAYTSRSLSAAESEFFTLSHSILRKDIGLGESLIIVETELQKAMSKAHLFESLLQKLSVTATEDQEKLKNSLIKALATKQESGFRDVVTKFAGESGAKATEIIVNHLFGKG